MLFGIQTEQLTKKFGHFTAVDGVTFQVRIGEIFGFLGANGAGKTTVIRMLCGLLRPSSGSGVVAGISIVEEPGKLRSRIGYMPQKFSLYSNFSVETNLKLFGSIYGLDRDDLRHAIQEISTSLELGPILHERTGRLPWGWQQRVALGCAVIHKPGILFLDEPTGSVDPVSRRRFWDFMIDLSKKETTIFVTTHHMDEAEYCDHISIMNSGRLIDSGKPIELKNRYAVRNMQELFLHLANAPFHQG